VPAGRGERDRQQSWLSALARYARRCRGSALVRALMAAPDLDGWAITERLLADLFLRVVPAS
jgi:LuxR family transcriptional regulator, maltose regulon positive regulatory protein